MYAESSADEASAEALGREWVARLVAESPEYATLIERRRGHSPGSQPLTVHAEFDDDLVSCVSYGAFTVGNTRNQIEREFSSVFVGMRPRRVTPFRRSLILGLMAGTRASWVVPAVTLTAAWFVLTAAVIGIQSMSGLAIPPVVAKTAPFLLAGVLTGLSVDVAGIGRKLIAAAVLCVVSAVGWTLFSFATTALTTERAFVLFFASLPVMLFAASWALVGMVIGARVRSRPSATEGGASEPEIADLERELNDEIALERERRRRV